MSPNTRLISFALVFAVTLAAAFMPWGTYETHGELKVTALDSASLPITVKAFGGYVDLGVLLIPNWFATLAILAGAVMGMCNAKKFTAFPSGVLMASFLIAAAYWMLLTLAMAESIPGRSTPPRLGMGLILTLFTAIAGCTLSSERVVTGKGRVWMTLIVLHLVAATFLVAGLRTMMIYAETSHGPDRSIAAPSFVFPVAYFLVAVAIEIVAIGLHRRYFWAWIAGLVVSSLITFQFCCCPPVGVFALWGLLDPASRAEFRKSPETDNLTKEQSS